MQKNQYAYPVSNGRFYFITVLIVVLFIFGLYYYLISDNGFKFTLSFFLLFVVVWWGEHYVKMFKDFLDAPYLIIKETGIYCHRLFDEQNIEIQWQNVLYAFFEYRGKKLILHLFVNDNTTKHIQLTANGLYFNDEKCDDEFANEVLQKLHDLIEQKRPKVTPVKQNQAVLDSPQIWTMPHSVSAVILWLGGLTILILYLIVVMISIETKSYLFLLLSSPFFVIGFVNFVLYFWKKARFHNHFYLDNVGVHFYHYELTNRQPVTILWEQIYDVDYFSASNSAKSPAYYLKLFVNPNKDTPLIIEMYFAIGNRFNKYFTKSLYDSIGKIILQKNGNRKRSDFISCSKLFSVDSGEYSFLCNDIEI